MSNIAKHSFHSFVNIENTHRDCRVRRKRVLDAILWLKDNNPYYKDITINHDALQQLPEDDVPVGLQVMEDDDEDEEDQDDAGPEATSPDDEEEADGEPQVSRSFLPLPVHKQKDQEAIRSTIDGQDPLAWPSLSGECINEFKTPGLATMAFPALFPYGRGDPTNPGRKRAVSLADSFKHLMKYAEKTSEGKYYWRFASHARFPYWALNMKHRHQLLSQANIYLMQHPGDANLTIEDLRSMVKDMSAKQLMNRVQMYATKIQGTRQYWRQRYMELLALCDQKGYPTFYFTVSAADNYWPDLQRLLQQPEGATHGMRVQAVINHPHLTDWFFAAKLPQFIQHWLYGCLDAKWHWYRYEWQARGSIHAHGCAKLKNDPGLCELITKAARGWRAEQMLGCPETDRESLLEIIAEGEEAKAAAIEYADWLTTTINEAIPDINDWSVPNPHPCTVPFRNVQDQDEDYHELVNTVERHTKCSSAYCLRRKNGEKEPSCRFGFPKELRDQSHVEFEEVNEETIRATLSTRRNDDRLNSHNRMMLQHWRANVDLQVVVDVDVCARYMAKYVSKSEPRSKPATGILKDCVDRLQDTDQAASALKKAMIQVAGERDMGAQETAHLLLQEPLYRCTYSFVPVSLDGNRRINHEDPNSEALDESLINLYAQRAKWEKKFPGISELNFLEFAIKYCKSKDGPKPRPTDVVIRAFPFFSPNPAGKNYPLYCKYQLIKYKPWIGTPANAWGDVEESDLVFIKEYAKLLGSDYGYEHVPKAAVEIMKAREYPLPQDSDDEAPPPLQEDEEPCEEWMLLCRLNERFEEQSSPSNNHAEHDWSSGACDLPPGLLRACPQWIASQRKMEEDSCENMVHPKSGASIDISRLNSSQRLAYDIIQQHHQALHAEDTAATVAPLRMIISGTAGTGKSYLIGAIAQVLQEECLLTGTTGMAGFNIHGCTLHSALQLPVRGSKNKELEGPSLQRLQMMMEGKQYILIDEMSMLGQKTMGWVDRRLRQASGKLAETFGGFSVILVGDFGQLPPVGDRPMYAPGQGSVLGDQGHTAYKLFDKVVVLTEVMRQAGDDPEAAAFRGLLLRLRNGQSTEADWKRLLTRAPSTSNEAEFRDAVRLFFDKKSVAEYNYDKLKSLDNPVARISAKHSGPGAAASTSDDAGGLDPEIFLCKGAKVMLTSNLWQRMGLCNGSPGEVHDILYAANSGPPDLPIAILVDFPCYTGPAFLEGRPHCVPIAPRLFEWESNGSRLSRLQVPLRLRYAMTIHKSQGQTLPKVVIDLGKSEKAPGCSFVAASRVRSLDHALFQPMSLERLQPTSKCKGLTCRLGEDRRLCWLAQETHKKVGQQNPEKEASPASDDHRVSPKPDHRQWDTVCEHLLTPGRKQIQDVTQIVQAERATIYQMLHQVRGIEPVIYDDEQTPERCIMSQLHPMAQMCYTAVPTSPDGNCLWHMVSLGLCGTEELMPDLRVLTLVTLLENERYFRHLLSSEDYHDEGFADLVETAASLGAWGGKFHLHALSLALKRPIYIYSSFCARDGEFYYAGEGSVGLAALFLERAEHTRQHFIYARPGQGLCEMAAPVMGFFTAAPGHFTAVLPNNGHSLRFIPSTNLFSHGNPRLLSHYFRY